MKIQQKTNGLTKAGQSLPRQAAAEVYPEYRALTNRWTHFALIVLVSVLAYSNTFSVPFFLDDNSSIVENTVIQNLGRFLSGEGYASHSHRFVGYLSFALNYHFGGLDVFGYHLVNLAIHIINGLLVYALAALALRASGNRESESGAQDRPFPLTGPWPLIPLLAALLFVAHPIQTQAITYIVQRLASLATLFYLGAVVCYAKGRASGILNSAANDREPPHLRPWPFALPPLIWYTFSFASAVIALHTKEIAATIPLAIILYEFCFYGASSRKKIFLIYVPLVTLALVVPISLALSEKNLGALLSSVSEMSRETTDLSRSDYLLTQFTVIVKYIGLILLPVNQSLEHNEFIYDSFFDIKVLSSFILIATIIASGIFIHILSSVQKTWKSSYLKALAFPESRFISFGIFWFFLALSVESSIIPIRDLIFEHRVYLPFTGAALMFSGVYSLAQRHVHSRYMSLVPMAIIIVLAFTTWHRNAVWREPMTLWKDAAEKGDLKDRPFLELGIVYLTRNDLNRALEYAHRAVELNPIHYGNWLVLGEIQIEAGQTENALSSFKEAIRLKPEGIKGRNTLAILNLRLGKLAEARQVLEEALAIAPDDPLLNSNMALVLGQQGEINAAIIHAQTAIRLKPDFAEAYKNLGTAYLIQGDVEHAKNSLEEALRYDPSLADAHNNLGMLLLQKRDMEKALYHFKRATDLKPDNVSFRNNLAAVEKYKK